eukprot:9229811-Pyramimonas_sp.AAC.1
MESAPLSSPRAQKNRRQYNVPETGTQPLPMLGERPTAGESKSSRRNVGIISSQVEEKEEGEEEEQNEEEEQAEKERTCSGSLI